MSIKTDEKTITTVSDLSPYHTHHTQYKGYMGYWGYDTGSTACLFTKATFNMFF